MIAVKPLTAPRALRLPRPDVSHHAFNVWLRNRDVFLKLWKTELFLPITEPTLVLLGMGVGLGSFVALSGGQSYVRFLAPGVLAQFPMFQAIFECCWGAYFRMANQGTYDAIASTPATLDDVVIGEILWGGTRAVINTVYILLVMLAFTPSYGIVRSPLVLLTLPVAALLGLCFGSISLSYAAIAPALSFLGYFFNLVIIPVFWLSGTFFPLERLPGPLQAVAWALPLTEVTSIFRHLLNGTPEWQDLLHVALVALYTLVFSWLAVLLVKRRLIK